MTRGGGKKNEIVDSANLENGVEITHPEIIG